MRVRLQLSLHRRPETGREGGPEVNTSMKVGAYLVGLAVVFAVAVGIGGVVGPVGPASDPAQPPAETEVIHGGMDMDGDES